MEIGYYGIAEECLILESDRQDLLPNRNKFLLSEKEAALFSSEKCFRIVCRMKTEGNKEEGNTAKSSTEKELLHTDFLTVFRREDEYRLIYREANTTVVCLLRKKEPYATVLYDGNVGEPSRCAVRDAFFFYLQQKGKAVLHSASFVYKNKACLFSAASGGGKSTQVRLWHEQNYPITDLNGDLAACFVNAEGIATAAGIPWCGTSEITSNAVVPIGAIVFLQKGETNEVTELKQPEKTMRLLARLVTPVWEEALADLNFHVAQEVAERVLAERLTCCLQNEAATIMKKNFDDFF